MRGNFAGGGVKGEFPLAARRGRRNLTRMLVAWTTVATQADAERLARSAVELGLAACVQVDAPVVSHYRWQGRLDRAEEFRLTFKLVDESAGALERHILSNHPYDTPEWIVVRAEHVPEKYLSWARANSSSAPL